METDNNDVFCDTASSPSFLAPIFGLFFSFGSFRNTSSFGFQRNALLFLLVGTTDCPPLLFSVLLLEKKKHTHIYIRVPPSLSLSLCLPTPSASPSPVSFSSIDPSSSLIIDPSLQSTGRCTHREHKTAAPICTIVSQYCCLLAICWLGSKAQTLEPCLDFSHTVSIDFDRPTGTDTDLGLFLGWYFEH